MVGGSRLDVEQQKKTFYLIKAEYELTVTVLQSLVGQVDN